MPSLPGADGTSARWMLLSFSTWASSDQVRAFWYILKRADWPVTGSAGFSGSFLAAGWGGSEQPIQSSETRHTPRSDVLRMFVFILNAF